MKFPSLRELADTARDTLLRFPLVMVSAVIAAFIGWTLIDEAEWFDAGHLMAAFLGIGAFLAVDLWGERKGGPIRWVASAVTLLLLIGYSLWLGARPEDDISEIYRYGLFALAVHLFVSFAGFIRSGRQNRFWEFNKTLFLRLLLSALFSGVLFGGLAVALVAVDQLLLDGDVIEGETYGKLFLLVGTLFNTLFFLAGVPRIAGPEDEEEREEEKRYPKGLKIFAANLLLPLVVIYLAILYIYSLKILIGWEWPQGWIGWLVLSFSVLGILALLLLWPLSRREENGWIPRFTRWFYLAVLPLIGLLFAAIMRRITEYGITENRYFVLALACWLAGISLYFLISKKKNIKIIPFSLFALALLSSFGPWSVFAVSARSQAGRFERLLEKHDMLVNGVVVDPAKGKGLSDEERSNMQSIIHYLSERDQLELLTEYLPEKPEFPDDKEEMNRWSRSDRMADLFGIGYGNSYGTITPLAESGDLPFFIDIYPQPEGEPVEVGGYDLLFPAVYFSSQEGARFSVAKEFTYEGTSYQLLVRPVYPELRLVAGSDTLLRLPLAGRLAAEIPNYVMGIAEFHEGDSRPEKPPVPATQGRRPEIEGTDGGVRIRLLIDNMRGYSREKGEEEMPDENSIKIESMNVTVLIGGLGKDDVRLEESDR